MYIPSGGSRENHFLVFSCYWKVTHAHSLASGLLLHLRSHNIITFLLIRTLMITLGPLDNPKQSPKLKIFNLNISAKSLCQVTYSQICKLGYGHLGPLFSLSQETDGEKKTQISASTPLFKILSLNHFNF